MSRNYSELMKEPSLAEKFLKAFWGEKMMAAILTCQQPNMMLQRCLMAKNNDIMQCQQEATEVEHFLLQGTLNAAFPDDYASFAQCLQSTPQDQMEKKCGPLVETLNEKMMKLAQDSQVTRLPDDELKAFEKCVGDDDDATFNCAAAAMAPQKKALDACLTKNGENVKTCIKQSEDLLVAIATYFKRAGVNQM